jgi:hypothetical protein
MSSRSINAYELSALIDEDRPHELSVVLRNLYASGCLLIAQGHEKAGLRVCGDVVAMLDTRGKADYFRRLRQALVVDPIEIGRSVRPSHELLELLVPDPLRRERDAT